MASIFPTDTAGGIVVRDPDTGLPTNPPDVENAYVPDPAYAITCSLTALPSDCTARIEPRQINAIVSELLSFAECLDPEGEWNCSSQQNLCNAFTAWTGMLGQYDDVLSFANLAAFPVTGEAGKIYIAENTNKLYRWNGTTYVEVGLPDFDFYGSAGQVETVTALRALAKPTVGSPSVHSAGFSDPFDGGGGWFVWDATSETDDDGVLTLIPDAGGVGRWKRVLGDHLLPAMAGVKGDGVTNNTVNYVTLMNAAKKCGRPIFVPPGTYIGNLIMGAPEEAIGANVGIQLLGAGESVVTFKPPAGSEQAVIQARGIPQQIFRRINAATKANPCVITLDDTTGLRDDMYVQVYGVEGMTQLNNGPSPTYPYTYYKLANVNHTAKTANLRAPSGTLVDSSAYGVYVAGGSVQKMVAGQWAFGSVIRNLTIHGNNEPLANCLEILGMRALDVSNVTLAYGYNGLQAAHDLAWHGFYNTQIGHVYAENPVRVEYDSTMPSQYVTGYSVLLVGIAGTLGEQLNGRYFTITKIDDTHYTLDGENGIGKTYGGGGASTYTNPDNSTNIYCEFNQLYIHRNSRDGVDDAAVGAMSAAVFNQCHVQNNKRHGFRINSHYFKMVDCEVAYNGYDEGAGDWYAGTAYGVLIGDLGTSCLNPRIEGGQFDSNKNSHVYFARALEPNITNVQMLYGTLAHNLGNPSMKGPIDSMISFGGFVTAPHISGLNCRFDEVGAITVALTAGSNVVTGARFDRVNLDNNNGGATVTILNSIWTSGNANMIYDNRFTLYDGTVVMGGKPPSNFRGALAADQNVTTTPTAVNFTQDALNATIHGSTMWDAATDEFIAPYSGYLRVHGCLRFANSIPITTVVSARVNVVAGVTPNVQRPGAGTGIPTDIAFSEVVPVTKGQRVKIEAYVSTGTTTLTSGSRASTVTFQMETDVG